MASQTGTAQIRVSSLTEPLPQSASEQLQLMLPGYVQSQRWFRAKARTIAGVTVLDAVPLKSAGSSALIIEVRYTQGEPDIYLLPVAVGNRNDIAGAEIIARLVTGEGESGVLYNALIDAEFRMSLLDAIGCDEEFTGSGGSLLTVRTNAFERQCGQWAPELESKVSRAEQSNTSILFGDQYILKIFRKLEPGLNPDIEIGKFLTAQNFEHTPAALGGIEYRGRDGAVMNAGILQAFVANKGDAWKYTLETLSEFFRRVLNESPPNLSSYHPFELLDESAELIGEYAGSARLLGQRTAQMHAALASGKSDPDFAPEPFTREYAAVLRGEMLHEADRAFGLLREKPRAEAQRLLQKESEVRAKLDRIAEQPISAVRIRHHGDYHLGQVLYTGSDFVIIDFEGEPARDLAARRMKTVAMRDVAGMARSFSYAGYAALFGQVEGVPSDSASQPKIEAWAAYWSAMVSAEFLRAYLKTAGQASFTGATRDEQRMLFDAFVLQKALYEVSYELNNRPDWVQIPLHGILTLIQ